MIVSALYIYPIKSLQGIKVPKARLLEKGFEHDRRWMLVSHDGNFITQRKSPLLAAFTVSLAKQQIVVSASGLADLTVPLVPDTGEDIKVTVWDSTVIGIKATAAINNWFSTALGMDCYLVYMPEDTQRPINPLRPKINETVSFADEYPYLIIGQSSLDDLNSRLTAPLPMNRFRPNIVFSEGLPYEEDKWEKITIGSAEFIGKTPCVRCVVTTIDQETGIKGKEPLKTLATYRTQGNGVIFGLNAVALNHAHIKVNDPITIHPIK